MSLKGTPWENGEYHFPEQEEIEHPHRWSSRDALSKCPVCGKFLMGTGLMQHTATGTLLIQSHSLPVGVTGKNIASPASPAKKFLCIASRQPIEIYRGASLKGFMDDMDRITTELEAML